MQAGHHLDVFVSELDYGVYNITIDMDSNPEKYEAILQDTIRELQN